MTGTRNRRVLVRAFVKYCLIRRFINFFLKTVHSTLKWISEFNCKTYLPNCHFLQNGGTVSLMGYLVSKLVRPGFPNGWPAFFEKWTLRLLPWFPKRKTQSKCWGTLFKKNGTRVFYDDIFQIKKGALFPEWWTLFSKLGIRKEGPLSSKEDLVSKKYKI